MSAVGAPRPGLRADLGLVEGYHSPQVDVAVRLNTNESPYPPPAVWRDELLEEVARLDFHRYPDRAAGALRAALGALHGVDGAQVWLGNGSNEVLQAVCLAFGGAGRTAAVFEPTYALHSHIAKITGTAVAVGERAPDFTLDLDEVDRVLAEASPAITFLCSPNNPTGLVDDPDDVRHVVERAPGIVVVDEAYAQFSPWSAVSLIGGERPVVVTRTFSKTWSMAAFRLGYLIGPAWLVAGLEKVTLPYHIDAVKQAAGLLALRHVPEMEERVARIVEERGRISARLGELPVDVFPSGANFVLFRPRAVDGRAAWEGLVARSVLVRDCSTWPRLEGCLRVTVGTPEENDAFLAALTEIL